MQLSHADIYEGSDRDLSVPIFRNEWEEEYLETSFQPLEIKIFSCISAIYYFLHFFIVVLANSDDGAGGNRLWVAMTWLPELFASLSGALIFALFTMHSIHKTCRHFYDPISAYMILVSYLAAVLPSVLLEVRRALFQQPGVTEIKWGLNFSTFPPLRTCNDTNPLQSHEIPVQYATSLGCNNLIISGNILSIYILHVLLPRIFRNGARMAIFVAVTTAIVLSFALLAVGTLPQDPGSISAVVFQLLVGLGAAYFCDVRKKISRQQFSVAKGTKFATEQNRNLLNTLMPQNVVQKLSNHKGTEMLGNEVKQCTIMFCSLEPQVGGSAYPLSLRHAVAALHCVREVRARSRGDSAAHIPGTGNSVHLQLAKACRAPRRARQAGPPAPLARASPRICVWFHVLAGPRACDLGDWGPSSGAPRSFSCLERRAGGAAGGVDRTGVQPP